MTRAAWTTLGAVLALGALAGCDDGPRAASDRATAATTTTAPDATVGPDAALDPVVARAVPVDLAPVAPPAPSLDGLCGPVAAATCRLHLGCRTGVTRDSLLACQDHIAAACEAELPALATRIAERRLAFEPEALTACLTRLDLIACDAPGAMLDAVGAACDGVFRGRLHDGDACAAAGDCGPGLACVSGPEGACPGRCAPLAPLGAACDAALAPCAAGLACEGGTCVRPSVGLGEACVMTAQCPRGAACDAERRTCVPRLATGATCTDDEACGEGDFCKAFIGTEDVLEVGTCQRRLAADAPCDPLSDACAAGLACDEARALCVPVPSAAGAGCVADVAPCGEATGLVCAESLCELEPFVGDACDPTTEEGCRFGSCRGDLASGIGVCVPFVAPGGACAADSECGALACVGGRCQRPEAGACHADRKDINLGFRFRIAP